MGRTEHPLADHTEYPLVDHTEHPLADHHLETVGSNKVEVMEVKAEEVGVVLHPADLPGHRQATVEGKG